MNVREQNKYLFQVVIPAAVKAAISKPMTEAERKSAEELKRIYDSPAVR
jgi:hypothetical protein